MKPFSEILWLMLLTVTTISYGNVGPYTVPGRLICFISCLFGVATFSTFIVSLNEMQQLNSAETYAYNQIVISNNEDSLH